MARPENDESSDILNSCDDSSGPPSWWTSLFRLTIEPDAVNGLERVSQVDRQDRQSSPKLRGPIGELTGQMSELALLRHLDIRGYGIE
jgi:hypothetical protein